MINNIKNKVAPYEHEGRWFKAFIEKDENGELKLTRCDLPGAELTEDGLKLPEGFHAVDYKFDTHYTAPAVLAGQEQTSGGGGGDEKKIGHITVTNVKAASGSTGEHKILSLTLGNYDLPANDYDELHIKLPNNNTLLYGASSNTMIITPQYYTDAGVMTYGRVIYTNNMTTGNTYRLSLKFAPDTRSGHETEWSINAAGGLANDL